MSTVRLRPRSSTTRVGGQGGRQRVPHPQHSDRGNRVIIVVDDDDPPSSTSEMEFVGGAQPVARPSNACGTADLAIDTDKGKDAQRKLARQSQHAKQTVKPQLQLPALVSDIIEISSGEDEPPVKKPRSVEGAVEKHIKFLEEENQRLKVKARLDAATVSTAAQVAQVLSTVEKKIECVICTQRMWRPYILGACGHTFCMKCLREWFHTAYTEHLQKYPTYNQGQLIPKTMRVQLTRTDVPPEIKRELRSKVRRIFESTRHPRYTCPTCRWPVQAPPVENFDFKDVIQTIIGGQGKPSPRDLSLVEVEQDGPFHSLFPFAKYI